MLLPPQLMLLLLLLLPESRFGPDKCNHSLLSQLSRTGTISVTYVHVAGSLLCCCISCCFLVLLLSVGRVSIFANWQPQRRSVLPQHAENKS
jgi:ABC-type Fe3+ transport system permease subunit